MGKAENRGDVLPVLAPVAQNAAALKTVRIAAKGGLICGTMCWLICVSLTRTAALQMRGSLGVLPPLEIGALFALFVFVLHLN